MEEAFHAHVYFDADSTESVTRLREDLQAELGGQVRISTLRPAPVGPHPLPMFEVVIPKGQFEPTVHWLMRHHGRHSVLLHPLTGNDLVDHLDHPAWLGTPLPLRLDRL